jgi:mRNA-degrading endonuclease RelE of RelBE toxin-antitoxin system
MSYTLIFHPIAEKEYLESIAWYEDSKTGLGERFIKEIESILDHLEQNPFLFPVKKAKLREANVRIFPYLVVYKINQNKKQVSILSVFHTSRNPVDKHNR